MLLILALASLALWAIAAFLVVLAVYGWWFQEDAGMALAIAGIALLAAYPAWLSTRATIRIKRTKPPIDAARRRFTLAYVVMGVIGGGGVMWLINRDIAMGILFAFVVVVGVALGIARDYEPARRKRADGPKPPG